MLIAVPVFNHGEAFARMLPRIADLGHPVLAVDDGSAAATGGLLDELTRAYPALSVVHHERNVGKGGAVATAIRFAARHGYRHVLQIDADGQHDAGDVPRFLALAEANPDAVVLGVPVFDHSVPRVRRIARYLTHAFVWLETLSFDIGDAMCGFRVYPVAPVLRLLDRRWLGKRMDFDPEILVRLHWRGIDVLSVPTRVVYPDGGISNFRMWRDNALITGMHVRLTLGMLLRLPLLLGRRLGRKLGRKPGRWHERR